jgi:hypothetical protein
MDSKRESRVSEVSVDRDFRGRSPREDFVFIPEISPPTVDPPEMRADRPPDPLRASGDPPSAGDEEIRPAKYPPAPMTRMAAKVVMVEDFMGIWILDADYYRNNPADLSNNRTDYL